MSLETHLEALRDKHTAIDTRLHDEENRPSPDATLVQQLKRQKLELKDELNRLSS